MLSYITAPVSYPQQWSCGFSSTFTGTTRVSGVFTNIPAAIRRKRPVGIEALFSPTYLWRQSGWYKGMPFTAKLQHWCWHGNGIYKQASVWAQLPLEAAWSPGVPGFPGGYKVPSDTEMLNLIRASSLNLAMVAAEYKKTAEMFEQIGESILRMYRDIRAGKAKKILARGRRGAPDTWMLYRYGLTPLAYDAAGLMDSMWILSQTPLIRSFRKPKREVLTNKSALYYSGSYIGDLSSVTMKKATRHVVVEYLPIQAFTSLGLTNPLLTAYELIPYSFVLDWFIGIGDYLASIDALVGVKRYSNVTVFRGSVRESWPGGSNGLARSYERVVGGALQAEAPRWDPSATWKRVVDSTILLRNLRK